MDFKGKLILAPMAGVGDRAYRTMCRRRGADCVVSEMVSADGLHFGSSITAELMGCEEEERPFGVQLFGANPHHLAAAAAYAEEHFHPEFIDLNSGCPVRKVVGKNGGASLLRDEKLFGTILESMVKAVKTPVTVKIRSGWNVGEWVDTHFARIAQDCGVAAITLHPRSKSMGFSGHSYWERIGEVKQAVSIPVIGNGDICSAQDALQMVKQTGCDALMVGRASYGNPWIFGEIRAALDGVAAEPVTLQMRLDAVREHIDLFIRHYGAPRAAREMKRHVAWYIKGVPGAAGIRDRLFRSTTLEQLNGVVDDVFSFQH
jgi:nifR3 family TIM-barrel protein